MRSGDIGRLNLYSMLKCAMLIKSRMQTITIIELNYKYRFGRNSQIYFAPPNSRLSGSARRTTAADIVT